MSWMGIVALALAVFLVLAVVLKAPRAGWEAIVAALLLGLAGYALQGQPELPAAPRAPDEQVLGPGAVLVQQRQALSEKNTMGDPLLMVADAYVRHGQYADAAEILRGAVTRNPNDGEAWLAMANALVGHAQDTVSPAALYAYRRASAAEPDAPGPPFFLGLALASSGRLLAARGLWAGLMARTPPNASWRGDLAERLRRLDGVIAQARAAGALQ